MLNIVTLIMIGQLSSYKLKFYSVPTYIVIYYNYWAKVGSAYLAYTGKL